MQPGEVVTSRSGTEVDARKNVVLFRSRIVRTRQPREFVRPKAARVVRRAVRPARMFTRTPRTGWPASLRQAVIRAYLRPLRFTFFAFTASWTGSRVYEVLCAAFAGFRLPVPGAYGMNSPFHG